MNLLEHNRSAWNEAVKNGNRWTIPVTKAEIDAAAKGDYKIILTPFIPVPHEWLGDISGRNILCLASGGGQQGPILAAAGAQVTVFDNSDEQLKRDQQVAQENHLEIKTVRGNMQDLGCFSDETFDLIIHPVSNCFINDIIPVWKESFRVLKENGRLLSGFTNPLVYMVDWYYADQTGQFVLANSIPYSDLASLSPENKHKAIQEKLPYEFGHSLSDQIQGQIQAGFVIAGFYEDKSGELLDQFSDSYIATRAEKLVR
ncbi:MAG: class I SAM-dependent methyltransferase [Chloroflexota bacterium]